MISKIILTILVAMTIHTSVDKPLETAHVESDVNLYESVYSGDENRVDSYVSSEVSDLLLDLATSGANQIAMATSDEEIRDALTELALNENIEVQYAYYGSQTGRFYMYPEESFPEDYDFRERPFYLNAMAQGIYYAEPYTDLTNHRLIQTICITVYDENGIIGVLGIDAYIE
ncbi:PDC sensor domain-containing protein [Fusibacter ferrireducens]|uniref:Cache domain-containing protein n=1 Tax=Fusibacter ferrireducens TaxID=2785058 RepID=A0ABR9ZPI1_9FIRM|nr:hypothetical protein [Fusibacter ferrireducens]MBF4692378.1 hypothetical protein [Fusibacter ferrireducens]